MLPKGGKYIINRSLLSTWNHHYQRVFSTINRKSKAVDGVLLGFHSVIDGFKEVRPNILETLQKDSKIKKVMIEAL